MKKIFTGIVGCLLLLSASAQVGINVVISQVFGAGGNSGAAYQNDYVELFNPTPLAKPLNNWSIQYASATGTTWQVVKLPNFNLQPGQYFLIKLATGGAIGLALPIEDASGSINMSGSNGKVALSNDTLALTSCLPNMAIVDLVGYGTANCFEGSATAPTSGGNTNSIFRANNGCQDGNNNIADFAAAAASPRNSASAFSTCGAATPLISVSPGTLTFTTTAGTPSSVLSYSLSASTLSPASGNIIIAPGNNIEISLSNAGPFVSGPSTLSVPYSSSTLNATPIFVRLAGSAPQGVFLGAISNSGGTAPNVNVTINGGVFQNYYNTKANLGLNNTGTWSSSTNGSGPSPANFTDNYQFFNIINQANANYTGIWDVSNAGNTARIVVGDGTNPLTFTILPDADSVTRASRIDVTNKGTLVIENNKLPFLNSFAIGSTLDFAQSGTSTTDTIRFPSLNYYNLKLTGGIKYFSTGTTTVRGDFTAAGVTSINGATTSVSKLNVFGNVAFANGTSFDAGSGADAARIAIGFNGSSSFQSLVGNGTEIKLFRIQRDTTTSSCSIVVAPGNILTLGGPTGGGLLLSQSGTNTTTLATGSNTVNFVSAGVMNSSTSGKLLTNNGIINVLKSAGSGDAGLLRFATGSTLAALVVNLAPIITKDTVTIADSVTVQNLSLTKGKIVVRSTAVLSMAASGSIIGGSAISFVDGKLRQEQAINASTVVLNYPIGKGTKYAPVQIESTNNLVANGFTIQYFNTPYSNTASINAATLTNFPNYYVSKYEYWNIIRDAVGAGVKLTLNWTDANSFVNNPAAVRMANFGTSDWSDLGTIVNPANTTTNGNVSQTGITDFGPFTLGATTVGVLPIKLEYIRGQKQANTNAINWKLTCLSNRVAMQIERAADARTFIAIGNIINATQIRCSQPFDYTDAQPLTGHNYYRLKIIDIDGKISYSPVIVINSKGSGVEIVGVYPSIVRDETSLSLASEKAAEIEIRITDIAGRILQSKRQSIPAGSSLVKIDCIILAKGNYQLSTIDTKGNITTTRFVKQ